MDKQPTKKMTLIILSKRQYYIINNAHINNIKYLSRKYNIYVTS